MRTRAEDRDWLYALAIALAFLVFLSVRHSHAHDWYGVACCGGKDCHPVNCSDISHNATGDYLWHDILFYRASMHPSQDGGCHVCVGGESSAPFGRCIYMPSEG